MYTGDLAGAEHTYLEAIEMDIALLGEDHPEVASGAREPRERLLPRRTARQDRQDLEIVLAMRRKALGDDSEPVARTLANIATVHKRAGTTRPP